MNLALLQPLEIEAPIISIFFLVNLLLTLSTLVVLSALLRKNFWSVMRPAFVFAFMAHFLYQWPLVLFSNAVEEGVQNLWWFAGVIHLFIAGCFVWLYLTKKYDIQNQRSLPTLDGLEIATPIILGAVFTAIYMSNVPWACTGLFALWADPWLTLLAREFSIKLVGTSLATYAFGALANIISPIIVSIAIFKIKETAVRRKLLALFGWICLGFISVIVVLLSGTKGLLIPTMIMLVVTSYLWNNRWYTRALAITLSMSFVMGSVIAFELLKERGGMAGARYDFAMCSVQKGVCSQSLTLMDSLLARDSSLGMPHSLTTKLDARLQCVCAPQADIGSCPVVATPVERVKLPPPLAMTGEGDGAYIGGVYIDTGWPFLNGLLQVLKRAQTVLGAIANRAVIIPFQVSTWHYMYAETEPVDGKATLPFARRLLGYSINIPELVYQKYGVIYSSGDRTSTSTAPTSFYLTYSAYLGGVGFLLALICAISFDIAVVVLSRYLRAALLPIAVSVVAVTCLNLMTSDFITVLFSHGGLVGLGLLAFYVVVPFLRRPRA